MPVVDEERTFSFRGWTVAAPGSVHRDAARLCAFHSEGGKTDTHIEVWVVPESTYENPKALRRGASPIPGVEVFGCGAMTRSLGVIGRLIQE